MAESVNEEVNLPVSIIKVERPDLYFGIWNQVLRNRSIQKTFYEFQEELNDYYCQIGGVSSPKFFIPNLGQLVVIRHQKDRRWHRATVAAILESSVGYDVVAFLVDNAEKVSVNVDWVRKITVAFSQFPFQAFILELPGIYPRSMNCDPETTMMHYSRASKWDTSAILYVDSLVKDYLKAEVSAICFKDGCGVVGDLYLYKKDGEVICIRSSLVSLGYAVGSPAKFIDDTAICAAVAGVPASPQMPLEPIDTGLNEIARLQAELDKKFEHFEDDEGGVDDIMPKLMPISPERRLQFLNLTNGVSSQNSVPPPPIASLNDLVGQRSSISSVASSCKISLSSSSSCYSANSGRNSVSSTERVLSASFGRGRAILEKLGGVDKRPGNASSVSSSKAPSPRVSDERSSVARLPGYGRGIPKMPLEEKQNVGLSQKRDSDESACNVGFTLKSNDFKRNPEVDCSIVNSEVVSVGSNGPRNASLPAYAQNARVIHNSLLPNSTSCAVAVNSPKQSSCRKDFEQQKLGSGGNVVVGSHSSSSNGKLEDSPDQRSTIRPTFGRGQQLMALVKLGEHGLTKNGFSANAANRVNGVRTDVALSRHHSVKPPKMPYFSTCMDKPLDILTKSKCRSVLVCGPMQPAPLMELKDAKFDDVTFKKLAAMKVVQPRPIQAYVWPALTRGRNVVAISGQGSGKSVTYLAYLLSRIKEKTLYADLPQNNQPVALVLCATWQKAKSVYDTACFITNGSRDARVFLIHGGGYDESRMEYLIGGCDLLVATPCSLLRLMKRDGYKPTGFTRLCYFVIDDADILIDKFREQMKELFNLYKSQFSQRPNKVTSVSQIMTFGTRWTEVLKGFIRSSMSAPLMFSSSFCENVVYAGVKIVTHVYKAEERLQRFFDEIIVPHHKFNNRKTLICTSHKEDALDLYRVVSHACPFTLLAHHGMSFSDHFGVSRKWHEDTHRPGEMPILITTDSCLENLNIEDAECVIHYDIPNLTKSRFARRFGSMLKYMRRSEVVPSKDNDAILPDSLCVAHLLITENSYVPACALVKLLQRLNCQVPKCLIALALGYYQYKEEQKSPIPLCYFMKAFGKCLDVIRCRDRHILLKAVDAPSEHLLRGIEVVLHITCVRNASQLYGRLVKHMERDGTWKVQNAAFLSLSLGMERYYSNPSNRVPCKEPKMGDILAVCVNTVYHRVRITYKVHVNEKDVRELQAFFIDDGKLEYIAVTRFLCLPDEFSSLPSQAFEVFLSHVRPMDSDVSWTDKANRTVQKMVVGFEMTGKIGFSLGNTLWLTSLTKQTRIINCDISLEVYNVGNELLKGYGVENPDHLRNLEASASEMFVLQPPIEYVTISETSKNVPAERNGDVLSGHLDLDEFTEVYLSCVVNPRQVYLQKTEFTECLDNLMNDIEKHVKAGKPKGLRELSEGMLCLAPMALDENNYYRAKIISIDRKGDGFSPDDDVFTFYLDYGDTCYVKAGVLFRLDNTFVWRVPFQAIECGLTNICPLDGAKEWSKETCDSLYHMGMDANGVPVIMTVKALKKSESLRTFGSFYEVVLYDTTDNGFNNVVHSLDCAILAEDVPESDVGSEDPTRTQNEMQIEENESRTVAVTNGEDQVNGQHCSETDNEKDFSVVPYVQWGQQSDNIRLTIKVANVKEENQCLKIEGSKLSFSATVDNVKYNLYLELIDSVKIDLLQVKETYVRIVLKKLHRRRWPRLTAKKEKLFFLSPDFDYCCNSSDEEGESWPQCTIPPSKSTNVANGMPPDPSISNHSDDDSNSDSGDSSACLDLVRNTNDGYDDFL